MEVVQNVLFLAMMSSCMSVNVVVIIGVIRMDNCRSRLGSGYGNTNINTRSGDCCRGVGLVGAGNVCVSAAIAGEAAYMPDVRSGVLLRPRRCCIISPFTGRCVRHFRLYLRSLVTWPSSATISGVVIVRAFCYMEELCV